jgi:Nucleotidyl transferase AbiEii toxin, Type IV TA system
VAYFSQPTAFVGRRPTSTARRCRSRMRRRVSGSSSPPWPAPCCRLNLADGLTFDLDNVTAEAIRDEDRYGGVRIRLVARLASAREPFHVDVNIGDPIWPGPAEISLPRLLGQEPIQLRGYSMEMVLAEKIVTALQRGSASTRWRDFGDIFTITGRHTFTAGEVRHALPGIPFGEPGTARASHFRGDRGVSTGPSTRISAPSACR